MIISLSCDFVNKLQSRPVPLPLAVQYIISFPALYTKLGPLHLRAEYRQCSEKFMYSYWDKSYDLTRANIIGDNGFDLLGLHVENIKDNVSDETNKNVPTPFFPARSASCMVAKQLVPHVNLGPKTRGVICYYS